MGRKRKITGDTYTMPTKKDLSKKMYKQATLGQRGYKVVYDEQADKKLRLKGITFIEKDGTEGFMTIADIVDFIFVQMDLDRMSADTNENIVMGEEVKEEK